MYNLPHFPHLRLRQTFRQTMESKNQCFKITYPCNILLEITNPILF